MQNYSDYKTLLVEVQGNIAKIYFNRPEAMNTYNFEMSQELPDCLESLSEDNKIKVIILSGQNKIFMAGGDIELLKKAHSKNKENTIAAIAGLHESILSIQSMDKIVIAAVQGACAGAGMSIMLACDFAYASVGTKFNPAYVHLGLSPDGGMSYTLPRLVGHKKAMELIALSEPFWDDVALELGIINQVLAIDNFDNQISQIAQTIVKGPMTSLAHIKNLLRDSWNNDLRKQLSIEQECFVNCTTTKDFQVGINAFLNKQKPEFNQD